MNDPYFKQSVIFMCEHDKNGAMGLIINKPFNDKMINDIFYQISDDFDQINDDLSNLYFGGPVYIDRAILLHDKNIYTEKSIKISNDLFISTYKKKLEDISKIINCNYRLFFGHAGWTKGQLENEISNGDWIFQETSNEFLFNIPAEQMWRTAIKSLGIEVSNLSGYGGNA